MSTPLLSVIIPAYNEANNFREGKLTEVDDFLNQQDYEWQVIVVDDGSTDDTADLINTWIKSKKNWRLIENPHHGKAKTVATGLLAATGQIRLFTDFDQATPISAVTQVISKFNDGFEVVIGSRELAGASRAHEPALRHIMGRVFNFLVRVIAVRNIHDTQCGFKAFSAKATIDLLNRLVVYRNHSAADSYVGALDVELIFLARKSGYKITEIPVTWKYVKSERINPIKDSPRMLWDILKIRWAYLTGQYA